MHKPIHCPCLDRCTPIHPYCTVSTGKGAGVSSDGADIQMDVKTCTCTHPFYNISTASKTCACGGRQHSIYRLCVLILKHSQMGYCVLYVEMLKAIPFLRDEICFFWGEVSTEPCKVLYIRVYYRVCSSSQEKHSPAVNMLFVLEL